MKQPSKILNFWGPDGWDLWFQFRRGFGQWNWQASLLGTAESRVDPADVGLQLNYEPTLNHPLVVSFSSFGWMVPRFVHILYIYIHIYYIRSISYIIYQYLYLYLYLYLYRSIYIYIYISMINSPHFFFASSPFPSL